MKKTILTGASILALSIAAPAFGQSLPEPNYPAKPAACATAGNNCSTIDQEGTDGIATVSQSGSGNVSDINQTAASEDVSTIVKQDGKNATSFVEQSGGPGVQVGSTFFRNRVEVTQSGDGADSVVYQGDSARLEVEVIQIGDSKSFIDQEGNNSQVEVFQSGGDGNDSVVFQSANHSSIGEALSGNAKTGVVQTGSLNTSEIFQGDPATSSIDERDLTARVTQNGESNDSFIIQTNVGGRAEASAEVNQQGNLNKSSVTQDGLLGSNFPTGTLVRVEQTGDDNKSDVTQTNRATNINTGVLPSQAFVTQKDDKNDSTIKQSSFSAQARVTQTSEGINPTSPRQRANRFDGGTDKVRGNFSNVDQSGNGENSADLIQTGQLNRSDIRQSNASGVATAMVVQDGIFNNSDIKQTAASAAIVNQLGTYGDNDSLIEQNADGASATVNQFGNTTSNGPSFPTNQSLILQNDEATASVTQTGSQNFSDIDQRAGANKATATVIQTTAPAGIGSNDPLNSSTIIQSAQTSAFVNQIGQGNTSMVMQSGANTTPGNGFASAVEVNQLGFNGNSSVTQSGKGNEAGVMQLAGSEFAESLIEQGGNDNLARVEQGGLRNMSDIFQTGSNNTATVGQYSDNNFSTVNQSGNGNTATVTQGTAPAL